MQRGDKHGFRVDDELSKEPVELTRDEDDRVVLAGVLGKEIWPATGSMLHRRVREQHAPDRVIDLVDRVPEGRVFDNLADLWEHLPR